MNQKKYQQKCDELIQYEDECFEKVKAFIASYNEVLRDYNCEMVFRRYWTSPEFTEDFMEERIPIVAGYACVFYVQFIILGTDPDDEENTVGFYYMENPTCCGNSFWFPWTISFSNYRLKLYSKIEKCVREIEKYGFESVARKYKK